MSSFTQTAKILRSSVRYSKCALRWRSDAERACNRKARWRPFPSGSGTSTRHCTTDPTLAPRGQSRRTTRSRTTLPVPCIRGLRHGVRTACGMRYSDRPSAARRRSGRRRNGQQTYTSTKRVTPGALCLPTCSTQTSFRRLWLTRMVYMSESLPGRTWSLSRAAIALPVQAGRTGLPYWPTFHHAALTIHHPRVTIHHSPRGHPPLTPPTTPLRVQGARPRGRGSAMRCASRLESQRHGWRGQQWMAKGVVDGHAQIEIKGRRTSASSPDDSRLPTRGRPSSRIRSASSAICATCALGPTPPRHRARLPPPPRLFHTPANRTPSAGTRRVRPAPLASSTPLLQAASRSSFG